MLKITSRIIFGVLAVGLALLFFDVGILQRVFDDRSIVEDGVVGADYYIVSVDGEPTERIQHGFFVTRVPFALIAPGEHVLQLSEDIHERESSGIVDFSVTIEKGTRYRLTQEDGNPSLKKDES